MYEALEDEYILVIKLHPAIRNNLEYKESYKDFLYDYSLYPNINDLFLEQYFKNRLFFCPF